MRLHYTRMRAQFYIRIGSSSEMQDKIDDLQLSSDDNDTRQMDELHEDSDASMKGK